MNPILSDFFTKSKQNRTIYKIKIKKKKTKHKNEEKMSKVFHSSVMIDKKKNDKKKIRKKKG